MVVFLAVESRELLELRFPRCYDGDSSIPTPKIGKVLGPSELAELQFCRHRESLSDR